VTPVARIAAAIELLESVETLKNRPADAVANNFFRERRFIGAGDRRAVSELVWSILRARRRLHWWLREPAPPSVTVGAWLLLDGWTMGDILQAYSGGRFSPAPLQPSEKERLSRLEGRSLNHPSMSLAVRLELPDWLAPLLEERFGADLPAEMAAMAGNAPLDLRANLLKTTRDQAQAALAAEGLDARPTPLSPWGLRIDGRKPVTTGPAFQTGLVEIQDEGSQLIALLVGSAPGMRVADWCAGAGGKTLAMAMAMDNKGQIVACDVSADRLDGAVRRLRRAGVHNVERHLIEGDGKWVKRRAGSFDRVLVDAPCTGTGTWRRNPDARTRLTETDLAELLVKQAAILDTAQTLVRKGGRLVYATCSLLPQENEAQVSAFLARHPAFGLLPLSRAWPLDTPPPVDGEMLSLTPAKHGTDGFFAAVLERAA